jgi:hypothetical protein
VFAGGGMKDNVRVEAVKDFFDERNVTNIAEDGGVWNIAALAQKQINFVQPVFGIIEQDEKTRRGRSQGYRESRTDRAASAGNENALARVGGRRWRMSGRHGKLRLEKTNLDCPEDVAPSKGLKAVRLQPPKTRDHPRRRIA